MRQFIAELKRRNVHRTALAYLAGSWLLVQILETLGEIYELDPADIQWVVLALAIAFVPTLIASWAFEWSSGGLRSQAAVDRDPQLGQSQGRFIDRVIIVALSLALLVFAAERFLWNSEPNDQPAMTRSIAVLPFQDMTESQDQSYFGDGLAEELLNLLSRGTGLQVAARTSSFSFREQSLTIAEIASKLQVDYVLEGSVRRDGDRLRVTAQLIEGASGYQVWSETFDEGFENVFSIQDRIAGQITNALEVEIPSKPADVATDPEAYALFLRGRFESRQGSKASYEKAVTLYQDALVLDPGYAPAWAGLANVYNNLGGQGLWNRDQGFGLARDAAERAVAAEAEYWGGHVELAWIAHRYDGDLSAAVAHMRQALADERALPQAFGSVAVLLLQLGRVDEAIRILEYNVERSPVYANAHFNLGMAYKYRDRLDEAKLNFERTLTLNPGYRSATYALGETLLLRGEPQAALEAWQAEDYMSTQRGRVVALYALGRDAEADAAFLELREQYAADWPSLIADVYAWRGDLDAAFEWLEKDLEQFGQAGWGEFRLNRYFDALRDDLRWQPFLERVGVSDRQLATYEFEIDRLPEASRR